jgi:hypothetical protein
MSVFSAAFPKQAPIRWPGRFMERESPLSFFECIGTMNPLVLALVLVLEHKPPIEVEDEDEQDDEDETEVHGAHAPAFSLK